MGNICCGSKDEGSKTAALIDPTDNNSNDLLREGLLKHDENNINAQQQNYGSDLSPQQIQQQQYEAQQQQHQQTIIVDQKQIQDEQQQQHGSTTSTTATAAEAKALREEQVRLELIVQATGRRMVAVRSTRGSTGYYDQGFAAALSQHLEQTTEFPQSLPLQIPSLKSSTTASTTTPSSSSPQKPSVSSPSSSSRDGGGQSQDGTTSTQKTSSTSTKSDSLYSRLAAPQFDGIQQHLNGGHEHDGGGHHDASVKTGVDGDGGVNKNPTTAYFDDIAESFLDTVIPKKKHLFAGTAPFLENLL